MKREAGGQGEFSGEFSGEFWVGLAARRDVVSQLLFVKFGTF
jgi:hypothetical protein